MSRGGWLALILLLAAALAVACWPERGDGLPRVLDRLPEDGLVLRSGGLEQTVTGASLRIQGLELRTDPGALRRLRSAALGLRGQTGRSVEGVDAARAGAYGLDGSQELAHPDGTPILRWGRSGQTAYAWDAAGRRLHVVPPALLAQLERSAGRLDDPALIPARTDPLHLEVDGTDFRPYQGSWYDSARPQRPAFNSRVAHLVDLIRQLPWPALTTPPATAARPLASLILHLPGGGGPRRLDLLEEGDSGWAVWNPYPPQPLEPAQMAAWREGLAQLRLDLPLVLEDRCELTRITSVSVRHDRQQVLLLERTQKLASAERRTWEVAWEGGREPAELGEVLRLFASVSALAVEDVSATAGEPEEPPGSWRLAFTLDRSAEPAEVLVLDGDRLRTRRHAGRCGATASLVSGLAPEAFLDTRLLRREPQRIAKLQRRVLDGPDPVEEVLVRGAGSAWSRSFPAGAPAPDPAAVDRLLRSLAAARMRQPRPATAGDLAQAQAPAIELRLRFAPATQPERASEELALEDTVALDWSVAVVRSGAAWQAIDADGGLAFRLDDEVVEALREPLDEPGLFPILPALVGRIELRRGAVGFALERAGAGWRLVEGGGSAPADATAVRRYLRRLGDLRGVLDRRAAEPGAAEIEGWVRCEAPALRDGSEQLHLTLIGPAGRRAVQVGSDRPGSAFPRGRALLPDAEADELLPPADAFRPR